MSSNETRAHHHSEAEQRDMAGAPIQPVVDDRPDQAAPPTRTHATVRAWPLLVLALPAAIAIWSGWVGIGQMTGFGDTHPLPGVWSSLHLDTAVTLPIGVEAYAAFAFRVWLAGNLSVSDRTRQFARTSAIAALSLGMSGQVAYHLLAQAGMDKAPWEVTTVVSCLPVLVLGLGSTLAHLIRSDSVATSTVPQPGPQSSDVQVSAHQECPAVEYRGRPVDHMASGNTARPPARVRLADAQDAVATVTESGQSVSRRSLRAAGLRGSNAHHGASPARPSSPA
jgi:hypothetical protein